MALLIGRRPFTVAAIILAVAGAALPAFSGAQNSTRITDEDQVKAAFLYNFAKFVQWPASGDKSQPLAVCVFGDDTFGEVLQQMIGGKSVQGRDVAVRRLRGEEASRTCHILFISAGEARHTADLLASADGGAVLTIGETPPFLREGGLVRFFVEGNRLRFQVNVEGAQHAGLKISSQLLGIAKP